MNLRKYYFECGMIFLNIMLRSSILYASETYYNLKEPELRKLERIEEGFLRRLFKTSKGCPIAQLYLEAGHIPARFHIKKMRLMFLKYILNEEEHGLISKFLKLQFEKPSRGDWASSCKQDLKDLKIDMSLVDIKTTKMRKFIKIINESISEAAFQYLIKKRGSKGMEISYTSLKMSEYLLPNDSGLSIDDKRYIFEIRNRMIYIPANFSSDENENICISCKSIEDMNHVYSCRHWNNENEEVKYENIFTDNIHNQVIVYKRFKENYEKRERYTTE